MTWLPQAQWRSRRTYRNVRLEPNTNWPRGPGCARNGLRASPCGRARPFHRGVLERGAPHHLSQKEGQSFLFKRRTMGLCSSPSLLTPSLLTMLGCPSTVSHRNLTKAVERRALRTLVSILNQAAQRGIAIPGSPSGLPDSAIERCSESVRAGRMTRPTR